MNNKFLRMVICILCIHFTISCLRPNVLSQIGKSKIYGTIDVPELDGCLVGWRDEWEWMGALETFGATSIDYKGEFLKEDVASISLLFFNKDNNVRISTNVILSELDEVIMQVHVHYDYEKKELIYDPVYFLQGESGNTVKYTDEESINEYLSQYGLTRKDVQEYQEYAIYEVVVKTWTKAHRQSYWWERWKLKQCKVVDNTFRFEEEKAGLVKESSYEEPEPEGG